MIEKIIFLIRLKNEKPDKFSDLYRNSMKIANTDDPQLVTYAMIDLLEKQNIITKTDS
jgi:predicted MarR family transcription regulator